MTFLSLSLSPYSADHFTTPLSPSTDTAAAAAAAVAAAAAGLIAWFFCPSVWESNWSSYPTECSCVCLFCIYYYKDQHELKKS